MKNVQDAVYIKHLVKSISKKDEKRKLFLSNNDNSIKNNNSVSISKKEKVNFDKCLERWKAPNLLQVFRQCPELLRLVISTSIIFFKYRIINKKMIVKRDTYDDQLSRFVSIKIMIIDIALFYEFFFPLSDHSRNLYP